MLVRAPLLGLVTTGDAMGTLARVLQAGIRPVEMRLLGVEFGVTVGHGFGRHRFGGLPGKGETLQCTGTPRVPDARTLSKMFSIGLVLSAGGPLGDPWHSGVLGRLQETTGWDARSADLVIGTSAGSITALTIRAGVAAVDRKLHMTGGPISPEAEEIYARIVTPYSEPEIGRNWRPASPKMALRAAWPPWNLDPARLAMANLPRGNRSGEPLEKRMNELLPEGWPEQPTWIIAVRMFDGRRVVFGRDDVRGTVGQAVRSSSAVPGYYTPGRVGDREYIDGGVHSSTNLDLAAMLGFDLVIVSSAMTAAEGSRSWVSDPTRSWFSNKLDHEVAEVRARGTAVVVIEPDHLTIDALDKTADNARANATNAGAAAVDRVLSGVNGAGLTELIERAAAD